MLLLPEPVKFDDFTDIIDEAESGGVVEGPWNEQFRDALETLASDPSTVNRDAAETALTTWITEWNSSLPA